MKTCSICKTEKDETEFHKKRGTKDGLQYVCKDCNNRDSAEWKQANPEKNNASSRKSEASRKERTGESANEARWRKHRKYLQRIGRSKREVNSGKKPRFGTCLACSAEGIKLQYHHPDTHSDKTVPLCRTCHLATHGKRVLV